MLRDSPASHRPSTRWRRPGRTHPTNADMIRATGISRSAVENALVEMSALAMVHRGAAKANDAYALGTGAGLGFVLVWY